MVPRRRTGPLGGGDARQYCVAVSAPVTPRGGAGELSVADLHLTLADLDALVDAARPEPMDAFLVAAGASQLVRDALEGDPASVRRVAGYLAGTLPAPLARLVVRLASGASRALEGFADVGGARRRLEGTAERLEVLVGALADAALTSVPDDEALDALRALLHRLAASGAIGEATTSMPSCFRSFDLHPNDLRRLALRTASRWPARPPGFLVLGVRTSGSYLAPLLASALRLDEGVPEVRWCTVRPGRRPAAATRALLASCANRGWRLVVVDDPPSSGRSLVRATATATRLGFPRDATCLAYALHEGCGVPPRLAGFTSIILDWPVWDVHRRLGHDAVSAMLSAHANELGELRALRELELPARPSTQGHARRGWAATLERPDGTRELELVAEGCGLGYLGAHALVVSTALGARVPEVLAHHDGVLVRRWLPESARVALDTPTRVRQAVDYVVARRAALPARRDAAASMRGRQPVAEVASRLLAAPFREAGLVLRLAALDAAVRRVLAPRQASVTDGVTGPGSWFEADGALVKVGVFDRAFSHLDLACYDAAYDLAGLTAGGADPELDVVARQRFEQLTGERVSAERLLCYRLVHLWDRARLGQLARDASDTGMARAWQAWAAERLLDGRLDEGTGPWCVLDVDGVLECGRLGAPTITPASASALRALRAHGFRTVLATGRSLAEVQDRCARFGLLGGVAEYGGVAYAHHRGLVRELVDDRDVAALAALRASLHDLDGVVVAEGFQTMVRAYRLDPEGRRRALDPAIVDEARHSSQGRLSAIRGDAQTDFVAFGVDKGKGVGALLELLGEPGAPIGLAVGDGEPDLPVLRRAETARVPSNARELAGGSIVATRASFQRGLDEAVGALVGHETATCAVCGPAPSLPPGAALLAAVLAGVEGGASSGSARSR